MADMKSFTVEQANATLPLVRRIVEDIVVQYRIWNEKLLEIDLVAASGRAADAELGDRLAHEAQAIARDIEGFRRETWRDRGWVLARRERRVCWPPAPGSGIGRLTVLTFIKGTHEELSIT
jgi:hypothetical protein